MKPFNILLISIFSGLIMTSLQSHGAITIHNKTDKAVEIELNPAVRWYSLRCWNEIFHLYPDQQRTLTPMYDEEECYNYYMDYDYVAAGRQSQASWRKGPNSLRQDLTGTGYLDELITLTKDPKGNLCASAEGSGKTWNRWAVKHIDNPKGCSEAKPPKA